jgi:hypothetical protein
MDAPVTRWLAALAALQIALAALFAADWIADDSDAAGSIASELAIDPALRPLTIESGYIDARMQAQGWDRSAVLFAVAMQVDWPLSVDPAAETSVAPGGWISFTFARPDTDGRDTIIRETLSLFYERTSGMLINARVVHWPESPVFLPLDPATLAIQSQTALMAIELKIGKEWRGECPSDRHLSRLSLTAEGGQLNWVITYYDQRSSQVALIARIDAESGDILSIDNHSEPCGETADP